MTTHRHAGGEPYTLPGITRQDRARYVNEARRLRAAEIERLLLAAYRGVARLWRANGSPAKGRLPSGFVG
jgi:hypothetical protein